MKKITILLVIMILAVSQLMAQAPQKFTYQAVVRNAGNQLVPNTLVGVQVAILQDGAGEQGTPVYAERHIQSTNANGLVTLKIGEGNVLFGNFNTINWKSGVFFIDVGIDPTGGSDYSIWSTQQMLSVPYALYANEAGNSFSGDYNDLTNLPQIPQIPTNVSYFNNDAGYITMDSIPEIPAVPTNVSAFQNDAGYITMDSVPEIPVVPTDVSAFTNDAGYLQSFTETQTLADVTMQGNSAGNRQLKDVADPTESYDAVNLRSLTLVMDSAQAIIQQMQQQLSQSQQEWQETQEQWQIQQQQMQQQWQETQQQWQIQQMQLQQQIDSLTLILNAMAADTAFTQWNTSVVNETACNAYEWHGETYTQSGVYLYGFTNTDGSNNVEALNLTIVTSDTTHLQEEACESYILNNTTYTESGDYYLFLTNQFGCDSVVFLHLTVHQCTHNVVTDTACETYTWHNVTYDESGVYTYAYTNEYGCASADTLHLTVYHGTHHVVTDTVCESYIWYDSTYTESGVYTYDYTNENGCASSDTLKLTVHYGTHNVTDENACGSIEWYGQTYTESGTYSYGYNNEYGCPSEDTLKVTVVAVDEKSCPAAPCVTDIDGNMYRTVQIGDQCWMRSNLRVTHFPDGSAIPAGNTTSDTSPFYYNTPNSYYSLEHRGYLYNWTAVMHNQSSSTTDPSGVQGVCPDGWHVPSDAEWAQLIAYVSSQSAFACEGNNTYYAKALAFQTGWLTYSYPSTCVVGNNQNQNNATGFSAVPAGQYYESYVGESSNAIFWTSSENSSSAYHYKLWEGSTILERTSAMKSYGFSVRCVLDAGSHRVESASACGSYEWHGQTYTESGTYLYSYNNAINLPSADTLKLTVYHGTHNVEADTACETFTWHETSYTESGTYTYAYTDDNGCASVDTLILTIFQGCTMDEKSCPGTPLLTDVDGNTYGTVQIGEQCWMRSNLRTLHYADGTAVPAGDTAHSETDPFYYDYESCFTLPERGYYYNWPAVMHSQPASCTNPSDVQGICPDGWHVPSDREWTQMIDYLADKSEYYCDRFSYFSSASLASDTGWTYNNSFQCAPGDHISHNATGFTAIPAGFYQLASRLDTWYISYGLGGGDCTQGAYFWCSTENSADKAYYRAILNSFHNVSTSNVSKDVGFSVRCIMNTETETDTIDEKSCPGTPSVTDIDGNTYPTVQIGDQCWMRSNLRTTRYADGTAVPAGNMNFSKTEPYYYNFSSQGGDGTSQFFPLSKRGYLYNWAAAMHGAASSNTNPSQVQGVCPNGWHVPSNEEWTQLENFVRSQSQYVCGGSLGNTSGIAKALTSTTGWKSYHGNICNPCYNPSSNNATGFNAMPVGSYDYNGGLGGTELTWFISSTENDSTSIHYCMLWYNGYYLGRFTEPKDKGFSVRCLRNENGSVPPPPSDCSSYHISISGGTVLCSGESTTLTASEASNYSWSNGSNTVSITVSPTATTTYSVTGTNSEGCVDSASITVTVNPATNSSIVETACGSFTWHDSTYTQSGTYTYAYLNEQGCASVDTLHLTVSNTDYTDFTDEACDSYVWNGETYTASGDYTQTFTAANGCDSVVTLHLTIHQGTHNVEVVESSEPYTWHGQTYTTSGTYTYVYTNENDCPSVDTLRLTVSSLPPTPPIPPIPPIDTLADGYPCPNAHTVIDHEGNVYNTVLIGNQCWTKENMRCITSPNTGSSLLTEFSSSASKAASWHSGNASHDPAYGLLYNWCAALDTFKTTGGVPEVAVANSSTTLYCSISGHRRGICPQGWHVPNDTEWAQLTSYVYNNGYRCSDCSYMSLSAYYASCIAKALSDTIGWSTDDEECAVGNDLFANNATGFSALPAGCYSSNSYRYYGQKAYFWSADVSYGYADNISMSYNSDEVSRADERMSCKFSVRCLKDIFDCGTHNVETAMDCESYTWHGQPYTATGTYTYEYTNERGCASVDTLKLVIQEHVYSETSATACDEYTSHGHTFTASGTYTYDYTNENDCPSTETLHLTILQPVTLTISATACDSYDWNGQILTQSGDYTQTFTAANGCDSVVTLHLVIHEPTISTSSASSCDSYNWHGQSYNASGTYTYDYTNEFDCASTETLNLTIYSGTHNVESAMDCESYTWHGQPYSATGTYTYEYTNAHGCPSVDTLHLTIQEHVNLTSAAASCESYIWHGQIYTASGSYTADYINDHGCSCTETLNLTIYNGTHNNYTEQACSSYNWYGTDYNLSGEYTYAYADEHGCPSVDTLRLTIGNTCPGTPTVTDHEGNVYNTIQIGNQCWTKENMRCTTSPSTGTNLLNGDNLSYSGKMAYYVNHDPTTVATLGLLYNWNAAVDVWNHDYSEVPVNEYTNLPLDTTFNGYCRGICPQGWHVPSDAEWAEMINYVKSQSEYWCGDSSAHIAKALAIDTGWVEGAFNTEQNPFLQYLMDYYESLGYFTQGGCAVNDNPSTNNATCFSAPPAGFYFGLDNIWDIDGFEPSSSANFFSSTQMSQDDPNYDSSFPDANTYNAYGYGIFYFSSTVARAATTKRYGNSVRCVKD